MKKSFIRHFSCLAPWSNHIWSYPKHPSICAQLGYSMCQVCKWDMNDCRCCPCKKTQSNWSYCLVLLPNEEQHVFQQRVAPTLITTDTWKFRDHPCGLAINDKSAVRRWATWPLQPLPVAWCSRCLWNPVISISGHSSPWCCKVDNPIIIGSTVANMKTLNFRTNQSCYHTLL